MSEVVLLMPQGLVSAELAASIVLPGVEEPACLLLARQGEGAGTMR